MTQLALTIPLTNVDDGNNVFLWDISVGGPQALSIPNPKATKSLYLNLVNHVQRFPEELDFCAIDLHDNMFDDKEAYENNVAQNLDEAVALSALLVAEIRNREENETIPQKQIIVIVNNWDDLFQIKDVKQAHLYMELWDNLKAVLQSKGAGVHLLMQVSSPDPKYPELQRIVLNS